MEKAVLFPHYFKKVGLILILFTFLSALVIKFTVSEMDQTFKEWFRICIIDLFMLGLLFVAFAKDKTENEISMIARKNALIWTFMWAVFYVMIMPVIDLLFNDPPKERKASEIIISMLITFLLFYYFQSRPAVKRSKPETDPDEQLHQDKFKA